jgi:peptidylprolyl isomerase
MTARLFFLLLLFPFVAACDSNEDDAEITIREITVGTGQVVDRGMHVEATVNGSVVGSCSFPQEKFDTTLGSAEYIEGLEQGLTGMRVGGTREVTIPPSLAFGGREIDLGSTCNIPKNATLQYTMTITGVVEYKQTDIVIGTGDEAVPGSEATVNYVGTLDDGSEFESGTFTFTVGGNGPGSAVRGFDRAVDGMLVGGRRSVRFPPSLGYGPAPNYGKPLRGQRPHQYAYEVLNFTITLEAVR